MTAIEQALERASDTKALLIADGALTSVADTFKRMFPGMRPIVVADTTTWELAGKIVNENLIAAGLNPDAPRIFTDADMHAEWNYIEELDKVFSETAAIGIAVGSGTINDLVKLSSSHSGRRYMTVATAASMDGYTAYGASITKDGAKQTFNCPAPLALVADTAIIAEAPVEMTASGYADLFAKIPAGADWIISEELGVEPIDEFSFGLVQNSLKTALSDPDKIKSGDKEAIHRLIEGLVMSGFAMQAHQTSRPASGADHQFSHLWNMEHHTMADGTMPSHGFQVSIGLLTSTALYEQLLNEDIEHLDINSCVEAWPTLEDAKEKALDLFRNTDFPTIGATEIEAKYIDRQALRRQLETLRDRWLAIKKRLKHQLIPLEDARQRLAAVGAPVRPEQIGISRERLRDSVVRAQCIRRRFTILDVAVRTCLLDKWLNNIFGTK